MRFQGRPFISSIGAGASVLAAGVCALLVLTGALPFGWPFGRQHDGGSLALPRAAGRDDARLSAAAIRPLDRVAPPVGLRRGAAIGRGGGRLGSLRERTAAVSRRPAASPVPVPASQGAHAQPPAADRSAERDAGARPATAHIVPASPTAPAERAVRATGPLVEAVQGAATAVTQPVQGAPGAVGPAVTSAGGTVQGAVDTVGAVAEPVTAPVRDALPVLPRSGGPSTGTPPVR